MAEGLLRHLAQDRFEAYSAGTEATRVRPLAIRAMAELGIDISAQASKTLERYLGEPFDAVITVCDQANEACPVFFRAKKRLHWSVPDPSQATGTEEEQLAVYRSVRDALRARIEQELSHTTGSNASLAGRMTALDLFSGSGDHVTRCARIHRAPST
jgi:arsenate reductase